MLPAVAVRALRRTGAGGRHTPSYQVSTMLHLRSVYLPGLLLLQPVFKVAPSF